MTQPDPEPPAPAQRSGSGSTYPMTVRSEWYAASLLVDRIPALRHLGKLAHKAASPSVRAECLRQFGECLDDMARVNRSVLAELDAELSA